MNTQTKTRTTFIDVIKGLSKAVKEWGTMFTEKEEQNITCVDDIPGIETYTGEDDIKLIRRMDSLRTKIRQSSERNYEVHHSDAPLINSKETMKVELRNVEKNKELGK